MLFPVVQVTPFRFLRRSWGLTVLAVLLLARPSPVQSTPLSFSRISLPGFGDRQNSYSRSVAWFNGKLYVGTNRDFSCVENATIAFYFPFVKPLQSIFADPQIPCPADPADLDLRAEIWRYTPETQAWDRIFQSDVLPNPNAPGKFVARDIGYRLRGTVTEAESRDPPAPTTHRLLMLTIRPGEPTIYDGQLILAASQGHVFAHIHGTVGGPSRPHPVHWYDVTGEYRGATGRVEVTNNGTGSRFTREFGNVRDLEA